MLLLTKKQMYEIDKYTINDFGVESIVLMEIAGKSCVDKIIEIYPEKKSFVVISGTGNNGGDGFVIARWLKNYGKNISVISSKYTDKMSPETLKNYELCKRMSISIKNYDSKHFCYLEDNDVIIDCLFGIGFKGNIKNKEKNLITIINKSKSLKIAVDIPSGVNADNGISDLAFQADLTLTIAYPKCGLYLNEGKGYSKEIKIISIGTQIKNKLLYNINLITKDNLVFPKRFINSHKGSYGKFGIIAGSQKYSGAAQLSTKSCMRSGAGLTTLIYHKNSKFDYNTIVEAVKINYDDNNYSQLFKIFNDFDAILIGPGLEKKMYAKEILFFLLKNWTKKLVLDADAINILSEENDWIKFLDKRIILTPHLGEFSRLIKKNIMEIKENWLEIINKFCKDTDVTLVLKSSSTIIANSKEIWINSTGNDGLATGGSGDVLAGIITGLSYNIKDNLEVAKIACFEMGRVVEKISFDRNKISVLPSDIIENLFVN